MSPLQFSRQTAFPQELPNGSVAMVLNSGASPADTWLSDPGLPVPATPAASATSQSALGLGDRMIMEQRLTAGRFILGIGSNLDLSSFQKSTRVSMVRLKEGKRPQICTHIDDYGGPGYSSGAGSCGQLDSSVPLHGSWS